MKILFLTANPQGTSRLRLDEEVSKIDQSLQGSRLRDQFELVSKWAVDDSSLRRALLEEQPDIVHFSGHGTGAAGLVLEGEGDRLRFATAAALADLFKVVQQIRPIRPVRCVLFSACYAEEQAKAVVQHVAYVIGMRQAVQDRVAILFAAAFYRGLGDGLAIEEAFDSGCNAIESALVSLPPSVRKATVVGSNSVGETVEPLADHLIPVLLRSSSETSASNFS
ncbi:MAG: CHAT domain-containing protein [Elainella sp.]